MAIITPEPPHVKFLLLWPSFIVQMFEFYTHDKLYNFKILQINDMRYFLMNIFTDYVLCKN